MHFAKLSLKNFLWVVLTAITFLPAPAGAQSARGRFTLTQPVQWGMAVLPPGDYRYSVDHRTGGTVTIRSLNDGQAAMVMATSLSSIRNTSASQLMLERHGDSLYVRSLVLGEDEEELHFTVPAMKHSEKEAALLPHTRTVSLTNP